MRPHVGAVTGRRKWEIAEDAEAARLGARRGPLLVGHPLQVLMEEDLVADLLRDRRQRDRIAIADTRTPVAPRLAASGLMDGPECRVVVEPPGLRCHERTERGSAVRVGRHLGIEETPEGRPQCAVLQRAHRRVIHPGACSCVFQRAPHGGVERGLATNRLEILNVRHVDEDRVQRHRCQRAVRRALARRHLVERQQLQQPETATKHPARQRRHIGKLADAPALVRRAREERQEQSGDPFGATQAGCHCAASIRASILAVARSKTSGRGSRLTMRNASRGKSKK